MQKLKLNLEMRKILEIRLLCINSEASFVFVCSVVYKLYMGIKLLNISSFLFGRDLVLFELGIKVNASKAIKLGVLESSRHKSFIHKQSNSGTVKFNLTKSAHKLCKQRFNYDLNLILHTAKF
jgi:hypothetical protein